MRTSTAVAFLALEIALALTGCGGAEGPKPAVVAVAPAGAAPSTTAAAPADATIRLRYYDIRDLRGANVVPEAEMLGVIRGLAPAIAGADLKNGVLIVRAPAADLDVVQNYLEELRKSTGTVSPTGLVAPPPPPPPPPVSTVPAPR